MLIPATAVGAVCFGFVWVGAATRWATHPRPGSAQGVETTTLFLSPVLYLLVAAVLMLGPGCIAIAITGRKAPVKRG
jgi:hypothetical protein